MAQFGSARRRSRVWGAPWSVAMRWARNGAAGRRSAGRNETGLAGLIATRTSARDGAAASSAGSRLDVLPEPMAIVEPILPTGTIDASVSFRDIARNAR